MQRYFTYGRKRRKAPDVSDVHLPDAVLVRDAQIRKQSSEMIFESVRIRLKKIG